MFSFTLQLRFTLMYMPTIYFKNVTVLLNFVRRQPLPNRTQEQITWPLPHIHTGVVFEQPLFYHYWKWLSSKVCICSVFLAECNLAIQSYLTFSV